MKNNCFFSILIPNYGLNDYLFDCLESVSAQKTNKLFEYEILVCDQSNDSDYEKIKKIVSSRFQTIKLLHSDIKGLFLSRHKLMANAKGRYICFIDSDDIIEDSYLKALYYSIINNSYPDIVVSSFKILQKDSSLSLPKKSLIDIKEDEIKDLFFYSSNLNNIWRKCFKKELYKKEDYDNIDVVNGEDWIFSFPLMKKAKRIIYDQKNNYYQYRQSDNSMTHKFSLRTGINQLEVRDYFSSIYSNTTSKQKTLLLKTLIEIYANVISRLIKNNNLTYRDFKSISLSQRNRIIKYCGSFKTSKLTINEFLIYSLLKLRLIPLLFILFKIKC